MLQDYSALAIGLGPTFVFRTRIYITAGADPVFFAGGGVNAGRVQRAPLAPAPTGGLGLINIRLRYIASIEYSERFLLLLL